MINEDLESITKTAFKRVGLVLIIAAVVDALLSWRPYKKPFCWG